MRAVRRRSSTDAGGQTHRTALPPRLIVRPRIGVARRGGAPSSPRCAPQRPMGRGVGAQTSRKRGSAPRLTADAVASHTAATTAPAKLTGICLDCGAVKSQTTPFEPGVDACTTDWARYLAFTHLGSFEDFINAKANDEELAAKAHEAKQIIENKKLATWPPTEVREDQRVTVRTIQPMIGPSRAQLTSWMGVSPEDVGMQLQTLYDVNKVPYKGILLPDPMRPYPCFEFVTDTSVAMSSVRMPAGKQLFEQQADDSFGYLKEKRFHEDKATKDLMTKFRTCPWTFEKMMEKCAEVRQKRGMAPMPPMMQTVAAGACIPGSSFMTFAAEASAQPAAKVGEKLNIAAARQLDNDLGKTKYGDDDGNDDKNVNEPSDDDSPKEPRGMCVGSVLNPHGVTDSMSAIGAETGRLKRGRPASGDDDASGRTGVSLGAKIARCKTMDGIPIANADQTELINRRVKSADLMIILSGAAMGREIGWLKKTKDTFQAAGDDKNASILSEHLRLCSQASKLAEEPIMKMPMPALSSAIKDLQDAQVMLPSAMQMAIYKRVVANYQTNIDEQKVDKLMATILPWRVDSSETESMFDGLEPRLCDLSGSTQELSDMFMDGLIGSLIPLVKEGEPASETVVTIAEAAMKFLENRADSEAAEPFDVVLGEVLMGISTLRAIRDTHLTMYHKAVSDFDAFANDKRNKSLKSNPLFHLHLAIKSTPYWWDLQEEHIARGASTAKHLPDINKHEKDLQTSGDPVLSGLMLKILKFLPTILEECKASVHLAFRSIVLDRLLMEAKKYFEAEAEMIKNGLATELDTWRQTLCMAEKVLPSSLESWRKWSAKLAAWEAQLCQLKALGDFDTLVATVTTATFGNDIQRSELLLATRKVINGTIDDPLESRTEQLEALVDFARDFVVDECESAASAQPVIEFLQCVATASYYKKHDELNKIISRLEGWRSIEKATADLMDLGDTPAARAASSATDAHIRELRSLLKSLEYGAWIENLDSKYKIYITKSDELIDEMAKSMIAAAASDLTSKVDLIREEVGGAENGGSWTTAIPAEDANDIDKVMIIADKNLSKMPGKLFALKLDELVAADTRITVIYDLFELPRPDDETARVIVEATVTKYTALMAYQYFENKKAPNPSRQRRHIKKYRTALEPYHESVHPAIWEWSRTASTF